MGSTEILPVTRRQCQFQRARKRAKIWDKDKGQDIGGMEWDRSRLEIKHRQRGSQTIASNAIGVSICLGGGSWCGNIYAPHLFMKEIVAYGTDLSTRSQKNIWSYHGTGFTTAFTSAYSGSQPFCSITESTSRVMDSAFCTLLLPFTVAELAKLLCKDKPSSPALNPTGCDVRQQFSPLIHQHFPATGFFCWNYS